MIAYLVFAINCRVRRLRCHPCLVRVPAFAAASVIPFVFGEGRPASQPKFVAEAKLITLGFQTFVAWGLYRSSLVVDHAMVAATMVREREDGGPLTVQIVGWGVVWGPPGYGLSLVEGPHRVLGSGQPRA
jgi:hypothetical protein